MKILIAGAGIGGLCAALCLQKSGHTIHIFEQATEIVPAGAGLQLGANAIRVLEYLGVLPQLKECSVAPERVEFRAYDSGDVLHSAQLGESYDKRYGQPYLHIHRADLYAVLLAALSSDSRLEMNTRVRSYQEIDSQVSVLLEDGRKFAGDCLIAADGVKSVVRTVLTDTATDVISKPKFTGNVAWRGVVSANQLPANFMDKVVSNFVGPNKHMVIYYLQRQQLINIVGVVENTQWLDDSWTSRAPWEQLKQDFEGWHETVQTVINAMDKQSCYRWALYDHAPLRNWCSKRVCLLGDAAHATLPFLASGAAMAIEDGRILQRSLDLTDNIQQALQCYQRNRFDRTAKVQKISRQMAKLYHINNPIMRKFAFKAIRLKSISTQRFLADYNANIVQLN